MPGAPKLPNLLLIGSPSLCQQLSQEQVLPDAFVEVSRESLFHVRVLRGLRACQQGFVHEIPEVPSLASAIRCFRSTRLAID